jgi:hypothetical protein
MIVRYGRDLPQNCQENSGFKLRQGAAETILSTGLARRGSAQ